MKVSKDFIAKGRNEINTGETTLSGFAGDHSPLSQIRPSRI